MFVVGVDIGGTSLRLALAGMDGKPLFKWKASTTGIRDPQVVVDLIHEGVEDLLRQSSQPRGTLRAIAVGAPGITDVDAGVVIATSYLMGWRDVPLRDLLEARLGVPVAIENDVNLAALAESRMGAARGTRDFVFIAIGTGIGAGIVLNGRLFHGMNWFAGEIGYMLVPGTTVKPLERGEPGALEAIVGGEGIKAQWRNAWREELTPLPKELMATQIFDHALAGDALAQTVLHRAAQTLTYAIYNVSLVLNCPLFVLGGSIGMNTAFWKQTRDLLAQREERVRPRLLQSTLGQDAQLLGAICLALETATSRTLSSVANRQV